jgi:GNAT superfamily N-acetyltransferase
MIEVVAIRELPGDLDSMIEESQREGYRFLRRLADEWERRINRFDRDGETLLAARDGGRTIGIGGVNIDPYAGDPRVGRIRHVYVLRRERRKGVGRRLVEALVAASRDRFDELRLRTDSEEAAHFYRRLGFSSTSALSCTHRLTL